MDTTILLADAAAINISGNLDGLGIGWETTGPAPLPGFVIIILVKVPIDWPDGQILELSARLVGPDGEAVKQSGTPSAEISFPFKGPILSPENRPPGLSGGLAVIAGVPPGLMLDSGIYEWVVTIGHEEWRKPFYVRASPNEFPAKANLVNPFGDNDQPRT